MNYGEIFRELDRIKEENDTMESFYMYFSTCYYIYKGMYKEALEICEAAIKSGQEKKVFNYLPELTYHKAECLFYLGETEEVSRLLHMAYYSGMAHEKKSLVASIKERAGDTFGVTIRQSDS